MVKSYDYFTHSIKLVTNHRKLQLYVYSIKYKVIIPTILLYNCIIRYVPIIKYIS